MAMWVFAGLLMLILFKMFNVPQTPVETELIFSYFMEKTEKGKVSEVTHEDRIRGVLIDGSKFKT